MKFIYSRSILFKALLMAFIVLLLKNLLVIKLYFFGFHISELIELSDITIVFTGAFFVFGLLFHQIHHYKVHSNFSIVYHKLDLTHHAFQQTLLSF